ncbi:Histone-lysine N-methyltransferase [Actinidia chinensis var. chinensis]|uniref:Histone-lysine N-methyltransferase n=1 Tax=Actinidia chinensis var. chinensis TaxID=1590841 RepID=A0A2R6R8X1_ACTCC|nr:Histone-lysine N-methyltransferase [Actinidia chinensis var. chinensis]
MAFGTRSFNYNNVKAEEVEEADNHHQQQGEEIETGTGTPIRYVPLCDLYSATSPCVSGSSNGIVSKKVKARKLLHHHNHNNHNHNNNNCSNRVIKEEDTHNKPQKPPIINFYSRKRPRNSKKSLFFDSSEPLLDSCANGSVTLGVVKEEQEEEVGDEGIDGLKHMKKQKRKGKSRNNELLSLGVDLCELGQLDDGPRMRGTRKRDPKLQYNNVSRRRKRGPSEDSQMVDYSAARWIRLSFDGVDSKKFIGLQCKVYWPLDDDWYTGRVIGYNGETGRHQISYEDGDEESIVLSNERIKFYVSRDQMQRLNLSYSIKSSDADGLDFSEMVVLAASFEDCHELGPGDIIWAKLPGHAIWPAIVVNESLLENRKGLSRTSGGKSLPAVSVQFFGTHDFAKVNAKQVISFLRGLLSSFHLKCKKPNFVQSLEEAKMYLTEQKLPKRMIRMQNGVEADDCDSDGQVVEENADSGEDYVGDEGIYRNLGSLKICPFEIGDLQVISLGKIVKDSKYFQDERFIWPEGYTVVRKFPSVVDPSVCALYKMEVLRDVDSRTRPLFRVTLDNGDQFKGSTPSACWNNICKRVRKIQCSSDGFTAEGGFERIFDSGSDMFGFSNPEVLKLIQELSNSKRPLKSSLSKRTAQRLQDLPIGYRPVHVKWKDLDKCNVCHMDEEYENNLFLQCDKCRMMVHAKCYGELEPVDGVLWLCNLCHPGAPDLPPPCCLCPVIGGAMKPTTDGRWAHLACAIWIPETCLSDVKKMEPIDGLSRINKDRWKLLCSICGVSFGACIQCSNNTCRVAYHPLCARAAGFCVELEDEDRLHLISMDEDEDEQCIRLLSFCKKHRPPSSEHLTADDRIVPIARQYSDYSPPCNPSGCARSEPYNYFGRRGRKEPEALAAVSLKRLFVENRPYLVGGYSQHEALGYKLSSNVLAGSKFSCSLQKLKTFQLDAPKNIVSMAEKYKYMRETFRKRLAFGKSGIHGYGIFAKQTHKAGDMMIEYTGELVRPPVADRREHLIYDSLVGAGTYMFRIDDKRVIDATRAGSIAHLINHSCEPNCYSRVISVNGDEHIIIFAKRDITQWEELTYDYRFLSIGEQLACYCGFPRCRGVVNDVEAEEQVAKLYVSRNQLIDWRGE